MLGRLLSASLACAMPVFAAAGSELREYCPDRPGLGTPACTIDRGHASFEVGLADWTLDRTALERDDRLVLGDALLRYGIGDATEMQLGWTSFGRARDRDRSTGVVERRSGVGDISLALRRNLRNPDGGGTSAALMLSISLPIGHQPIGAGDWGAEARLPLAWELDDRFTLELVPEADAAVDEDGNGRHLAYGAVIGLETKLGEALTATGEYQRMRDRDPARHTTQQFAGLSLGWQPKDDLQFDIGANGGLNRASSDLELYIGVARRF